MYVHINTVGLQGFITLPSRAKLREGQPDGYILTCTQPVMSTVCIYLCEHVCMCVWDGRPAKRSSTEQRADRRVGRGTLAGPQRPSLKSFTTSLLAEGWVRRGEMVRLGEV